MTSYHYQSLPTGSNAAPEEHAEDLERKTHASGGSYTLLCWIICALCVVAIIVAFLNLSLVLSVTGQFSRSGGAMGLSHPDIFVGLPRELLPDPSVDLYSDRVN
ncbi:uncharacterized protein FIBRA_08814 [Fibroporia radiculosa]|uniref:Uncharacterized protein n=1 Tax=Fibroporia radiculosa TaxID=599839 RepID=J4GXG4_9APHY|nr:uncharacterized protein FIBRA_08814 [Fibroporia radiculosa]CCM06540.1 predicted protein [Fibroporia radiculosa]